MPRETSSSRRLTSVKIWQANLNRNKQAYETICQDGLTKRRDIILLQEPGIRADYIPTHPSWILVTGKPTEPNGPIRAVTLIRKDLIQNYGLQVVDEMTNENMVTVQIGDIQLTNLYNHQATSPSPLQAWIQTQPPSSDQTTPIIAGDFNLHNPLWQTNRTNPNRASREWVDWTMEHDLTLRSPVNTPTHVRGNVIDLVFAHDNVHTAEVVVSDLPGSDHRLLSWQIRLPRLSNDLPITESDSYNYKSADWDTFAKSLKQSCRTIPTSASNYNTQYKIDQRAQEITSALQTAISDSMSPLKLTLHSKRWWTQELSELKRERMAKFKLYRQDPTESTLRTFQSINDRYELTIRDTKSKCWKDYLMNIKGNDIWQAMKYVRSDKRPTIISRLSKPDGTKTQSFKETAQALSTLIPQSYTYLLPMSGGYTPSRHWPDVKTQEIETALFAQAPNKAPGPDGIKTIALQKAWKQVPTFRRRLKQLIRSSLRNGYFPRIHRTGRTLIIPKPGKDPSQVKSYRPITLLNTMGKLMEKIVQKRLYHIVCHHLPPNQFGSRPGYSAPDALAKLVSEIEINQSKNKTTSILAIDIKGAFDNVNHFILLETLQKLAVPYTVRKWIQTFLQWRSTSLVIDRKIMPAMDVPNGIPQGSPLSPLLFLIYTTELYNKLKSQGAEVIGYVDDITIYVRGYNPNRNTKKLQKILNKCHEWAADLRIEFDYGPKLGWMHFNPKDKKKYHPFRTLKLPNGDIRNPNKELKLLGLTLDRKLKYHSHVQNITRRAKQAVGAIGRLGGTVHGVTGKLVRQLYISCVRPILEYSSFLWYPNISRKDEESIQRIQNLGLRKALGAYKSTPIDILHRDANVLPIRFRQTELADYAITRLRTRVYPKNPAHRLQRRTLWATTMKDVWDEFQQRHNVVLELHWPKKPPWTKAPALDPELVQRHKQIRKDIHSQQTKEWEKDYQKNDKGNFYRSYTKNRLYGNSYRNPVNIIMANWPRNVLSKVIQLRSGHGDFGSYYKRWQIHPEKYKCPCGAEDSTLHKLTSCNRLEAKRNILRESSPILDTAELLDTPKGLKAVARFLTSLL